MSINNLKAAHELIYKILSEYDMSGRSDISREILEEYDKLTDLHKQEAELLDIELEKPTKLINPFKQA